MKDASKEEYERKFSEPDIDSVVWVHYKRGQIPSPFEYPDLVFGDHFPGCWSSAAGSLGLGYSAVEIWCLLFSHRGLFRLHYCHSLSFVTWTYKAPVIPF